MSDKTYEISPFGRNDGLFMAFDQGEAWCAFAVTKPLPDHITACHSVRSEESDFNIINEPIFL